MKACLAALICAMAAANPVAADGASQGLHGASAGSFPLPLDAYEAAEREQSLQTGKTLTLPETLAVRVRVDPFNLVATLIFFLAIVHTFLCARFNRLAHHFDLRHSRQMRFSGKQYSPGRAPVSFRATLFHFLGEVEVVFGIWMVPLFAAIFFFPGHGWNDAVDYIDSRNFTEPIFVVVIMAIASTRPIVSFAARGLRVVAGLGGGTPAAWWLSILTIGPLLGSFITEPAAMTIGAMLLGRQFFQYQPSTPLKYATLALLFVNVSVGGTLTHFAAPPVLMVASAWNWDFGFMFTTFGWRAMLGILIVNAGCFVIFRRELFAIKPGPDYAEGGESIAPSEVPAWIVGVHVAFLAWTVVTLHHPALFVGAFLFFIAFTRSTQHHQYQLSISGPVLVGFFLAALVVHGGLQGWWIAPLLGSLGESALFMVATVLTAFNDNAAITFLAAQVPAFNPEALIHGHWIPKEGMELARTRSLEYAVVAGAVTGGGLTVIANAPNPAGQNLLSKYFGRNGISPGALLVAALAPTGVMAFCFMILPH